MAASSSSSSSSPPSSSSTSNSSPGSSSNWLSGVNVVLVMAYGSLVRSHACGAGEVAGTAQEMQAARRAAPFRRRREGRMAAARVGTRSGEAARRLPGNFSSCEERARRRRDSVAMETASSFTCLPSPFSSIRCMPGMYTYSVFVLLFIFVKRQIMRFAMKSRRGPHVPVGQHAPKGLKEEIDIRLSRVQDIKYEPRLLSYDDVRLLQLESPRNPCSYNYVYRMKALDAVRDSDIPFSAEGRHPKSLIGKNFRAYLVDLRNSSTPFKGIRKTLIDTLLDGYDNARYGTGTFGKVEFLKYQEALYELAAIIKARGGGSQRQHQSAAKDLTLSPDISGPTIQVTYLPSSQKSKRAKHFLELKSFKDNYNTLESTL